MIPLEEARAHVLGAVGPLTPRTHALAGALGLVLAEDVLAPEAVPPFAGSAMDGFAVRAADTNRHPAVLTIIGTIAAGQAPGVPVGAGEAARIMTGAPMPAGADAVVMVERTAVAADGATVEVLEAVEPGTSVRPAGDDLEPGQLVLRSGEALTPGHLGVLASVGRVEVRAHPRPRVGVFSTGDELVDPPQPLQPGQIRDSNRLTLLAMIRQCGFAGVDLGRAPDDPDAITAAVRRGVESCDAVVTSGGVSMGDFDYVKVVLDRLGEMRWMQVAVKPAKPLAFGTVGEVPVFGLPGNPVSSMVSFELFARPALRRMAGHRADDLDRPCLRAEVTEPLVRRPDGKVHLARVVCRYDPASARFHVASAGRQGSHQLSVMTVANALAVLPDGPTVEAGNDVEVMLLDGSV